MADQPPPIDSPFPIAWLDVAISCPTCDSNVQTHEDWHLANGRWSPANGKRVMTCDECETEIEMPDVMAQTVRPASEGPLALRPRWECFHCGETFLTRGAARIHFGFDPSADPGCVLKISERGLLGIIRDLERDNALAWDAVHGESTEAVKAMRAMAGRHAKALVEADEAAYAKGLGDAIPDDWTPTPDNINALPEPLRRYIHDVASLDPSSMVQDNHNLESQARAVSAMVEAQRREVAKMRGALEWIAAHRNDRLTDGSDATRACLDMIVKMAADGLKP